MLIILGVVFLILLFSGMPVAFSMLVATIAGIWFIGDLPWVIVPSKLFLSLNSFPLMAVPFFILAGEVMNHGGITHRLVRFAESLVAHLRGGLAQVNVVSNMLMSGISGSAAADCAAIGSMLIPSMKRAGYPAPFAVGLTAAASTMGPIIPPSILMIIYAGVTNMSVGALFLAGIVPGVTVGISLMILVAIYARHYGWKRAANRASLMQIIRTFADSFFALLTPVIIVGGILSGVFTATESGALACVYAILVGKFIYKELKLSDFPKIFVDAAVTTAVTMVVLACASVFGFLLARAQFSVALVQFITAISDDQTIVWFLIIAILLVVGMFVEALAAMLIFIPALAPLVAVMGYDPLHFALVFIVLILLGAITPPVGLLLYISCSIGRVSVSQATIWPFVAAIVVVLLLMVFFPAIVLSVPRAVLG